MNQTSCHDIRTYIHIVTDFHDMKFLYIMAALLLAMLFTFPITYACIMLKMTQQFSLYNMNTII